MNRLGSTRPPSRRIASLAARALASSMLPLSLMGASAASAQESDPPALVGRISGINGQVSMHRADQQDWSEAGMNEPVTVGDAVYAGEGGEAKLQVGGADLVLKEGSEIDIASLDQDNGRLRLDTGALDVRIYSLPTQDGLYIVTPRGTVRITRPGIFRIEAGSEDQPTRVTAWAGSAELGDSGAAVAVQPGQTLVISGTPDAPQYSYMGGAGEPPREWRRPPRIVAESRNYVPQTMTGAEDLYEYGNWQPAADYGPVWYPSSVPVGWAPYRYGHWDWVAPWGWTWIDDQPWGFAPFHYGRWAFIGGRWGWCPGEHIQRPVYAPALVAFIGGAGWSASLSMGGGHAVGWVPLAPGEYYRPPYRVNNTYVENINRTVIVNNVTINQGREGNQGRDGNQGREGIGRDHDWHREPDTAGGFRNRQFATVVPGDVMGRARPVAQAAVQVPATQIEKAPVNAQTVAAITPPIGSQRPVGQPGPVIPPNARDAFSRRPPLPAGGRGGFAPANPGTPVALPGAPPQNGPAPNGPRPETASMPRPEFRPGGQPAIPGNPPTAPSAQAPLPATLPHVGSAPNGPRPETASMPQPDFRPGTDHRETRAPVPPPAAPVPPQNAGPLQNNAAPLGTPPAAFRPPMPPRTEIIHPQTPQAPVPPRVESAPQFRDFRESHPAPAAAPIPTVIRPPQVPPPTPQPAPRPEFHQPPPQAPVVHAPPPQAPVFRAPPQPAMVHAPPPAPAPQPRPAPAQERAAPKDHEQDHR